MPQSYQILIARLTDYAHRHPRLYKARVAGLAVLGYAYLLGALLVLAGLVAVAVWFILHNAGVYVVVKLAIPIIILIGMIGRSLWVRYTPPQGIELERADAPALFAEIDHVRAAMRAPRVHRVLIDDQFNAGVSQYPRLGVFGWYRVYLVIGLPMLAALPPDEFRGVLAHEFGHVSRAHGRFGAWIGRVRRTWLGLMAELDHKNHWGRGLFRRFFHWYAPYFEAFSTVLVRANEYEADRMAAAVSGGAQGAALCRVEVTHRFLESEFWSGVFAQVRERATPPDDVHRALLDAVRASAEHPSAAEWLAEALRQPTRADDTHPALRDRLAALGMQPTADLPPVQPSAAEALLGAKLAPLADRLSREWMNAVKVSWSARHARAVMAAQRLSALAEKEEAALTAKEAGERIWLTADLQGDEVAIPQMRAFLDEHQEDAAMHFRMGRALARRGDESAIAHLERAIVLDHEYTQPACAAAAEMLERAGREDAAAAYRARFRAYEEMLIEARYERNVHALRPTDVFLPHGLDAEGLAKVRGMVDIPGVKRAYLVRKFMRRFPEQRCYVLAIVPGWSRDQFRLGSASQRLAQAVLDRVALPGSWMIVPLEGEQRKYAKPLRAVAGSEVFRRPSFWKAAA